MGQAQVVMGWDRKILQWTGLPKHYLVYSRSFRQFLLYVSLWI